MKKIFSFIALFIIGITSILALDKEGSLHIRMYPVGDTLIDEEDRPEVGHRMPPRKITCYINFSDCSVEFSPMQSEEPVSYEVWKSDFSLCISSSDDSNTFVKELAYSKSSCAILIIFQNKQFMGFLE